MRFQSFAFELGIGSHTSFKRELSGGGDPCGDFGAAFGGWRQGEIDRAHRSDLNMKVNPVEQRSGKPSLIFRRTPWPARADVSRFTCMAAATRVHCRDKLNARRECHVGIGPGDIDLPGFKRLTQRIEHRALEFRKLVEEQHAQMRKADLAGADLQPSAG